MQTHPHRAHRAAHQSGTVSPAQVIPVVRYQKLTLLDRKPSHGIPNPLGAIIWTLLRPTLAFLLQPVTQHR